MIPRSHRTGLTLITGGQWILPRKHSPGFLVEAQPDILCSHVQHAVGIVGEVSKVRNPEFFSQEGAERKAIQPFTGQGSCFFGLACNILNRSQLFQSTKIVRMSTEGVRQMALGTPQVAVSCQPLAEHAS